MLVLSQSVKHVRSTCPILRFQTYAESLLVALLYCVSFGDRNTRIPFVCNALKIWEVRNFPLDFLGQVRNIPRAEFSPAEKTPYRISPPRYAYPPAVKSLYSPFFKLNCDKKGRRVQPPSAPSQPLSVGRYRRWLARNRFWVVTNSHALPQIK